MSHLGHMYANGLGVKQDNGTALQWFEKGATKGHKNAHFGLGYMYLSGYGVRQNHHKAFHHFSKVEMLIAYLFLHHSSNISYFDSEKHGLSWY